MKIIAVQNTMIRDSKNQHQNKNKLAAKRFLKKDSKNEENKKKLLDEMKWLSITLTLVSSPSQSAHCLFV